MILVKVNSNLDIQLMLEKVPYDLVLKKIIHDLPKNLGSGIPDISLSDLPNQTWVSFSFSLTNRVPHLAHKGIFPDSNWLIRFFTLHAGQGIMTAGILLILYITNRSYI